MQSMREEKLQSNLAAGWSVLLGLFLAISLTQLMQGAIDDNFTRFAQHPGSQWGMLCIYIFAYGLMATLTRMVHATWFRWLNAALLAFATISMLQHQIQHIREGVVYGLPGLIDLAHHITGALLLFQAIQWIKAEKPTP